MKRKKKSVGAWVGEAFLIFLSIMLAFYFENYRDQHSKEKIYINQLKDFHFDLKINQGRMKADLREPGGSIEWKFRQYDSLLNMLSVQGTLDMTEIISVMKDAEHPLAKWFFQSPRLDLLMTDYYSFIKNVELKRNMSLHKRRMNFIDRFKDELKVISEKMHPFYDRLDRQNPYSLANQQVVRDVELYNLILRLNSKVGQLKDQYLMAKEADSLICVEIEKELSLWNESL